MGINLVQKLASGINAIGEPLNKSLWDTIGEWFANLGFWFLDGISYLIFLLVRFVLNIVDFLQIFAERLIGVDYWKAGNVSADNLGESDVLFKFLFNSNVQRVFRYLMGIFAVLLIVFTIIAIVKSEWAYVTDEKNKVDNSKGTIFKRSLKAIALVVLFPVMIVMGVLASNAILASLINALNINNNLTLGGQVFTASAYDASKFKSYAANNIRYSVTNSVWVDGYDERGNKDYDAPRHRISTALKNVKPSDYDQSNPFWGYLFSYYGKDYLYYAGYDEVSTYGLCYLDYFEQLHEADPNFVLNTNNWYVNIYTSGHLKYTLSAVLDNMKGSDFLNKAAYNTWNYNEILARADLTFDQTTSKSQVTFISDAGIPYPDAYVFENQPFWGLLHDGGVTRSYVPTPDEYYVMGDVIDYMIADNVKMAIVNTNNPLINWEYAAGSGDTGYLDGRYVHLNSGSEPRQFMVSYKNDGNRVYEFSPNGVTSEDGGAIYIVAYYDERTNTYVPVVNNKSYVDQYGKTHAFKSDYLNSTYTGLIVARGNLQSTYSNRVGFPTVIKTEYRQNESGNLVSLEDPHYSSTSISNTLSYAKKSVDLSAGFNSNFVGLSSDSNGYFLSEVYSNQIDSSDLGNESNQAKLKNSLPVEMELGYLNESNSVVRQRLEGLSWSSAGTYKGQFGAEGANSTYFIFRANKTIKAHIDNQKLYDSAAEGYNTSITSDTIKDVPLYAFVVLANYGGTIYANTYFAYSQYTGSGDNWYTDVAISGSGTKKGIDKIEGDGIFGDCYNRHGFSGQLEDVLKARFLQVSNSAALTAPAAEDGSKLTSKVVYVVANSLAYNPIDDGSDSSATDKNAINTRESVYLDVGTGYSYIHAPLTYFLPEITGDIVDTRTLGSSSSATLTGVFNATTYNSRIQHSNGNIDYNFALCDSATGAVKSFQSEGLPWSFIVTVTYTPSTGRIYIKANDMFKLYIDRDNQKIEGLLASPYTLERVSVSNVSDSVSIVQYRYNTNNQYYYFNIMETAEKGIINLKGYDTSSPDPALAVDLLKINISLYNLYTFTYNGKFVRYDPSVTTFDQYGVSLGTSQDGNPIKYVQHPESNVKEIAIASLDFTIRASNAFITTLTDALDGTKQYQITLYADNGETASMTSGSPIATLYCQSKDIPATGLDNQVALMNEYTSEIALTTSVYRGNYTYVPRYVSLEWSYTKTNDRRIDAGSLVELYSVTQPTVQFVYDEVRVGKWDWKWDWHLDLLEIFTGGVVWRIKGTVFSGSSDSTEIADPLYYENGIFWTDYNFNSMPGLKLQTYYIPGNLNILVLVFASFLLFMVLGQAIWGLIGRLYDITLYFVIMPGVVSTLPLGNDKMYQNWKTELVKKVFGAYGVMIGINFFFILVPAIRDASQIFTEADLLRLGNSWLAFLTPHALNNLVYILFMLVAFTLIKSLPKTIAGIMDVDDVYSKGADVKKAAKGVLNDVGRYVSGQAAVDSFKSAKGTLKNFIPGSAIADEFKNKMKGKQGGKAKKEAEAKQRGIDNARAKAESLMQQSSDMSSSAADSAQEAIDSIGSEGGGINVDTTNAGGSQGENHEARPDRNTNTNTSAENQDTSDQDQNTPTPPPSTVAYAERAGVADELAGNATPPQPADVTETKNDGNETDQTDVPPAEPGETDQTGVPPTESGETDQTEVPPAETTQTENATPEDETPKSEEQTEEPFAYAEQAQDRFNAVHTKDAAIEDKNDPRMAIAAREYIEAAIDNFNIGKADADKITSKNDKRVGDALRQYTDDIEEIAGDDDRVRHEFYQSEGFKPPLTAEEFASVLTPEENAEVIAESDEGHNVADFADRYLDALINNPEYNAAQNQISSNLVEGLDANASIEYLNEAIAEKARLQGEIDAEGAKRTGWVNAAAALGYDTSNGDIRFAANQAEHDAGLPWRNEATASSDRLQQLKEEMAQYGDPEAQRDALTSALAQSEQIEQATKEQVQNEMKENKEVVEEQVEEEVKEEKPEESEKAEDAENAEHAANADKSADYQRIMDAIHRLTESAANQAEAARLAAEASRLFADIAGDRIKPIYEKKLTRDEKKLAKLEGKRAQRDADQEAGDAHIYLKTRGNRIKAYNEYNEGKSLDESIIRKDSEAVKNKAIEMWRQEHGGAQPADAKEAIETYFDQIKNEQAIKLWNKTHGAGNQIDAKEFANNRMLREEVLKQFGDEQYKRKAVARNNFLNEHLDTKIEKQKAKMELKEQGLYESLGKRAALFLPRRLLHKTTDKEREKLQAKREQYQAQLDAGIKDGSLDALAQRRLQTKITRLDDAIGSDHRGVLPFLARQTAEGGRYVRSKWYQHRFQVQDKKQTKAQEKVDKIVTFNGKHYSEKQYGKLAVLANDKQVKQEQLDAFIKRSNGKGYANTFVYKDGSTAYDLRMRQIKEQYEKKKKKDGDEKALAAYNRAVANLNNSSLGQKQKQYLEYLSQSQAANAAFDKLQRKYDKANGNNFYTKANERLTRKQAGRIAAERRLTLDKMNNERRKGLLTEDKEQRYINTLAGLDAARQSLGEIPARFKRLASAKNHIANGIYKGKQFVVKSASAVATGTAQAFNYIAPRAVFTGSQIAKYTGLRTAYRHHKRVKAAKAFLATDSAIAATRARREGEADRVAARVKARVDQHNNAEALRSAIKERDLVNATKQALAAAGKGALGKGVTNAATAREAVNEALKQLKTRRTELNDQLAQQIANKAINDQRFTRQQKQLINKQLRSLRDIAGTLRVTGGTITATGTVNARGAVKGERDSFRKHYDNTAVRRAMRSEFKDEMNKLLTSGKQKKARSAAEAERLASSYKQQLLSEIKSMTSTMTKEQVRLAKNNINSDLYKLKNQLNKVNKLTTKYASQIRKMERDAKSRANQESLKKWANKVDGKDSK